MHAYSKRIEISSCVPSNYMAQEFDINERMRGILIDWLIEVHYKFELMDETLYLTVNLTDRFLTIVFVVCKKLQLFGVTALLLALKYEEVSVPVVEDLILISDKAYTRKEVLEMQQQQFLPHNAFSVGTRSGRRHVTGTRSTLKISFWNLKIDDYFPSESRHWQTYWCSPEV